MQGIDLALAKKEIQGLCLLCFEDERPPRGALGYVDWLFAGHFTKLLKTQVITGKKNQLVYTPILWNGSTFHFLVMGGGYLHESGMRPDFDPSLLNQVAECAERLALNRLGIIKDDWKLTDKDLEAQDLEKRKICVLN